MTVKRGQARSGRVRVTFDLKAAEAESVSLCGDFNDWSPDANPMTRRKDGRFSTTVTLDADTSYRFRYFVDGERWENDWVADEYLPNQYGGDDSVVHLDGASTSASTGSASASDDDRNPGGDSDDEPGDDQSPGSAATGNEPALAPAPEPNEPA